jgi:hypothetical protein
MKTLFIFLLHVLLVVSRFTKRMNDADLTAAINQYVNKYGDAPGYWRIYHLGFEAPMDVRDSEGDIVFDGNGDPLQFDAGHHWVVAEPLTGPNGVYNGKNYVKSHLSYAADPNNKYAGTIQTKINVSPNTDKEMAAKLFHKAETANAIKPSDMLFNLGKVVDENFVDGKPYYMFNKCTNCQGFSESLYNKVFEDYAAKADAMEIC